MAAIEPRGASPIGAPADLSAPEGRLPLADCRYSTDSLTHFELVVFGDTPRELSQGSRNSPRSPDVEDLAAVPHDLASVGYVVWFDFMMDEFLPAVDERKASTNGGR